MQSLYQFALKSIFILFLITGSTLLAQEKHTAKYVPRPEVRTSGSSSIEYSKEHLGLLKAELLRLSNGKTKVADKAIEKMNAYLAAGRKVLFVNEYKSIQQKIDFLENNTQEESKRERDIHVQKLKEKNISTLQIINELNPKLK